MKKIIIGLALVGCTLTASATKVNWGLTDGASLTGISAGQMYLCYAAGDLDWTVLDGKTSFSTETLGEVGFSNAKDSTINYYDSNTYAAGASKVTTLTPSSSALSGAKSFYTVIIADDGKTIAYTTSSFSASISNSTSTSNVRRSADKFTTVTVSSSVPEPTCGVLLLLGVAGLALRRKHV